MHRHAEADWREHLISQSNGLTTDRQLEIYTQQYAARQAERRKIQRIQTQPANQKKIDILPILFVGAAVIFTVLALYP